MHGWSRQHLLSNLSSNNISDPLGRNRARAGEKTKRKWRKTRHELYSSQNTREWSETYTVSCHKYWRPLQDTNNCLLCLWLLHPRHCQRSRMAIVRANPQLWYKKNINLWQFHYLVPWSRVIMYKLIVTQRLLSPLLGKQRLHSCIFSHKVRERSIQCPFSHSSFSRTSSNRAQI